jgi:hypothetical protein
VYASNGEEANRKEHLPFSAITDCGGNMIGKTNARQQSKRGKADRSRVAGNEGYEVNYFASKHGITGEEARNL